MSLNDQSNNTNKKPNLEEARNQIILDKLENNFSAIMDTYTELMAKKKSLMKQSHKEISRSFYLKQKSMECK